MTFQESNCAVVVVTYRRYGELDKTLRSIIGEGIPSPNILVIDNNQGEDRELGFYQKFPGITPILTDSNISSSGGFELGMKTAHQKGFSWLLLFNDDSRPLAGALQSLKEAWEYLNNGRVGLIKLGNLNAKGQAVILNWKGVRKPVFHPVSTIPVASDLVTFDGCLISSELMDQIGYCDPDYFMGTYEFDYCLKARDAGFQIYTLPNGLIEDGKLGSVGGTPPWRQYYNTRNHLWLGLHRKELGIIKAWLIRELKFTYAILRWEDQKKLRLRLKALATWHALTGKRGKTLDPLQFNK